MVPKFWWLEWKACPCCCLLFVSFQVSNDALPGRCLVITSDALVFDQDSILRQAVLHNLNIIFALSLLLEILLASPGCPQAPSCLEGSFDATNGNS